MSPFSTTKNDSVLGRQIAFFAAFVLPVYKLLELPSVLARFAQGDLLLPALLQFLLQAATLALLLFFISRSEMTLFERLNAALGKWSVLFYALYAVYFLFAAVLPVLDLEKFVYAAFYDTPPTLFSFAVFFIFCAYFCIKGVRALGRVADISLFLFLLPFLALIVMSLVEADFSNLLPFFENRFSQSFNALTYTAPHFSDVALLLPLLGNLRFRKKDGTKILLGYGTGAVCSLLFLAVFYGVYSSIAPREHYAFAKIAQYFPVLAVIGRIDLLFVYMLSIVLFFLVATPLRHAVAFTSAATGIQSRVVISAVINVAFFFFTLFCNRYYDAFYAFFGERLFPLFWVFSVLLPLILGSVLPRKKEKSDA